MKAFKSHYQYQVVAAGSIELLRDELLKKADELQAQLDEIVLALGEQRMQSASGCPCTAIRQLVKEVG